MRAPKLRARFAFQAGVPVALSAQVVLAVLAQLAPPAAAGETVVVTATRLPQSGFALPAAIDAVRADEIREGNPQVNLSETLNRVPGIVVQNRQNYAQDLQVSSRGFGGRATFGVRGVRLIADGIPATMPDGQGQAATFDLASADRIEVLRGPFASLYGNSSGGVVQVFTADGPPVPTLDAALSGGSFGQRRVGARFGGEAAGVNFLASASHFETEGYREHSAAKREHVNAKLKSTLGGGRLTVVFNALRQPDSQDPLGLTRAQFEADPRQADAAAFTFDTRKSVRQAQAGATYDYDLTPTDALHARAYAGDRTVLQYLAMTGDTPLGSGGVVDLDRSYGGAGLRWTRRTAAFSRPLTFTAGLEHDRLEERRRGFVNQFGVAGAPKRDEDDRVSNRDVFAQFEWDIGRWIVSGGARRSRVEFVSRDRFITATNPDDSGRVEHAHTAPVLGVLYKTTASLNLYANAGEGFETPTFAELAYRPAGATGLNFDLAPSRSRHVEAGFKARGDGMRADGAIFRIETRDEIVTNASAGGRTDFRNAARTLREGLELALAARLGGSLHGSLALTALRARFEEGFESASAEVAAGQRLPGVPAFVAHMELAWRPPGGFHAALEARHSARIFVNEANTDAAAAYTVANVRLGFEHRLGHLRLREFLRVDNVADRRYAGSVIVAEARGRYFEPAPGRSLFAGIEATF